MKTFLYWVVINMASTFLFTLFSLPSILNLFLCAITAPYFALNPVLGVGIFGGVVELTLKKPKVKDFEAMSDDSLTLKGWYKNRILHALVVFLFSSLGSVFGTLIAFPYLLTRL